MKFNTDQQTLDDLNILDKPGRESIYSLYNNTHTRGGADILENMFLHPLADFAAINNRSGTLQYFCSANVKFPFMSEHLDSAEIYLAMTDQRTKLSPNSNSLSRKLGNLISAEGDYKLICNGIAAIIEILQALDHLINRMRENAVKSAFSIELEEMGALLDSEDIVRLLNEKPNSNLSHAKIVNYDNLLRFGIRLKVKEVLACTYKLDVYMSVAEVATKRGYTFPRALETIEHTIRITGVYHPLVKNAIPNTLYITPESNVVFLTGANMAGKSTFMKSIGIALYLAHMGFPVASTAMEFSVRDGIYTTINLPDDLNSGNSHFYAEVLRVKKIAKELSVAKNLFIIFDELFRGTNVKDAYEGTIAITEAFAQKRNSMFVVSTHIVEAGDVLHERCSNINFVYLPTKMDNNTPIYTYKLEPGITADRHGMVIINNEGILEILRSRQNKVVTS